MFLLNIGSARRDIVYLATYTWNYACQHRTGGGLFYLWSLSVEEQFYLFWPFVVLLLRRRLPLLTMLTLTCVAIGYGQLLFNFFPALDVYNYTGLINRMGSLSLGALGAVLIGLGRMPVKLFRSVTVEMSMLAALIWAQGTGLSLRFPVMGLCSLFFVMKCVHGEFLIRGAGSLLDYCKLQYLGRISYGVYLLHVPVAMLLEAHVINPLWASIPFDSFGVLGKLQWHSWLVKLPLNSAAAILLASASYRWIERPILARKDIWFFLLFL